jgi:hypothetical protein
MIRHSEISVDLTKLKIKTLSTEPSGEGLGSHTGWVPY